MQSGSRKAQRCPMLQGMGKLARSLASTLVVGGSLLVFPTRAGAQAAPPLASASFPPMPADADAPAPASASAPPPAPVPTPVPGPASTPAPLAPAAAALPP